MVIIMLKAFIYLFFLLFTALKVVKLCYVSFLLLFGKMYGPHKSTFMAFAYEATNFSVSILILLLMFFIHRLHPDQDKMQVNMRIAKAS